MKKIETILYENLPSLFDFLEGDIRWKKLNKIFEKRFKKLKNEYSGNPLPIKRNLYSTIIEVLKGDVSDSYVMLCFLDRTFNDLTTILSPEERRKVSSQTIASLLEFGDDYLNYFGELAVLYNLVSTHTYTLDKVEYFTERKLPKIDYRLINKETNKAEFIEVLNVFLDRSKLDDDSSIESYLSGKLKKKLCDTDKSGITEYELIPVLWGENESIIKVREFYERTNFKIDRVLEPRAFIYFLLDKKWQAHFGSIFNIPLYGIDSLNI